MATIKANGTINGHELKDIEVVNPGDWFGKTWLIEIGGSYSSHYLVIEADSMSDAIDELADSEKHGHHIVVEDEYLGDYVEDSRHYGPSGQVLDLDHIMIHGQEGSDTPFPCMYHGDGLPSEGVKPTEFCWDEIES
ncbi:hypothetical protein [Rhodopirellula sallentina]|uniref:Uncharacterized protein n=1 Tax=Rhodopirellula sallentina SM41 TaxID=1263870 RepID=M5TY77_9BACT|nr:hypothetical protein [Rhodopirellula sallentina]EMI54167.1 hypothetical protein RSSM_04386 [Rhodopirellula sallentina SM41]